MTNDQRGVFISWSKSISAQIAKELRPFLDDVLGQADIFMSQSMDAGTRWAMEIPQRLESCNAGLILVTKENSREPWLHFETGALSKKIEESLVIPLLHGATMADIQGTPLAMFQARELTKENLLDVCTLFGSTFGVGDEAIKRRFDKGWLGFEEALGRVKAAKPKKDLGFPDLMAMLERVAGQVTAIEGSIKYLSPSSTSAWMARRATLGDLVNHLPDDQAKFRWFANVQNDLLKLGLPKIPHAEEGPNVNLPGDERIADESRKKPTRKDD